MTNDVNELPITTRTNKNSFIQNNVTCTNVIDVNVLNILNFFQFY